MVLGTDWGSIPAWIGLGAVVATLATFIASRYDAAPSMSR
jgi:hypothetical protein